MILLMKQTKPVSLGSLLRSGYWSWLVFLFMASCTSIPPAKVYESPSVLQTQLESDLRTLSTVRPHFEALDDDFVALRKQGDWVKRGYFSVSENDRMEHLLFRFIASHTTLWNISAAYQNMQTSFDDPALDTKARVVSRHASLLLANHSAFLVAEFADDPIAIAKMNEAFYRSEIPGDSYYELARGITAKRLTRLKRAGALAAKELANPNSKLAWLAASDASYRKLIELNQTLHTETETRMRAALGSKGTSEPKAIRKTEEFFGNELYAARSMLFKDVSRLKNPTAKLIRFSDEQKVQVYAQLRPGDLILTYTAGYISDVFIPGAFKHGITYVGSPKQREQAGAHHGHAYQPPACAAPTADGG